MTVVNPRSGTIAVRFDPSEPTVTIKNALAISNEIDSTAFDLNAAAFSSTTSISNDYILDNIEFNFSTTESKTITVTTADGTEIYKDTNTAQQVSLGDINQGFNGGENITVAVTQYTSAGTMDCVLKVRQGTEILQGDPTVKVTDGTDELDLYKDKDTVGPSETGIAMMGLSGDTMAVFMKMGGLKGESLKVVTRNEYLLEEIGKKLDKLIELFIEVHDLH